MTEEEWLHCRKAEDMVHHLVSERITFRTRWHGERHIPRFKVSERQWRLFYCACVFRIEDLIPVAEARQCVVVAERYAEGLVGKQELEEAIALSFAACSEFRGDWPFVQREWINAVSRVHRCSEGGGGSACLAAAVRARALMTVLPLALTRQPQERLPRENRPPLMERLRAVQSAERAVQADLLRDIVDNPFKSRPSVDPDWQRWHDGLIPAMAQKIHDERRFEDLPVLADMLEEAGCDNEAILTHCRGPGPHVRGCWLVDLLLGKS
jgi:hypothetical protein